LTGGKSCSASENGDLMKTVTNPEARQALLEQLRTAVCLQTSLWDACLDIDEMFAGECDAVSQATEVILNHRGKELDESDVVAVLSGLRELNASAPTQKRRKTQVLSGLDRKNRAIFLRALQNVIALRNKFWICASELADFSDCQVEWMLSNITSFSVTSDTGLELNEMDLHAFLCEREEEGRTWTSGPLEPQVRH
jgi:hypothetical protein